MMYPFTHAMAEAHTVENRMRILKGEDPSTKGMKILLKKGDAVIMDSRLLHHGTANKVNKARCLFYFTAHLAGSELPVGSTITIRGEYLERRGLVIREFENWTKCEDDEEE